MYASFIPYPMVEEEEAAGRVAAVYARALEHSPFVPSLLKSLAACPPYLVTAWEQAEAALAAPDFSETADRLAASVRDAASPPSDPDDCELLRRFLDPLGRMLLLSCGLLAALRGEITGVRSADGGAPPSVGEGLRRSVSSASELEAASVFARIRATLHTPIINTVWRRLAEEGRLEAVWDQIEPQAHRTRPRADRLQEQAMEAARQWPWGPVADRDTLRRDEIEDAAPGTEAILDAYTRTLPRVLTVVACCGGS